MLTAVECNKTIQSISLLFSQPINYSKVCHFYMHFFLTANDFIYKKE
jgi:hypothetical protein